MTELYFDIPTTDEDRKNEEFYNIVCVCVCMCVCVKAFTRCGLNQLHMLNWCHSGLPFSMLDDWWYQLLWCPAIHGSINRRSKDVCSYFYIGAIKPIILHGNCPTYFQPYEQMVWEQTASWEQEKKLHRYLYQRDQTWYFQKK